MSFTEGLEPPASRALPEQFASLPAAVQARMFRVLDVIIGSSHEEKAEAYDSLEKTRKAMARLGEPEAALEMLNALTSLLLVADVAAHGALLPAELRRSVETLMTTERRDV